jgi:hypothetical protein
MRQIFRPLPPPGRAPHTSHPGCAPDPSSHTSHPGRARRPTHHTNHFRRGRLPFPLERTFVLSAGEGVA